MPKIQKNFDIAKPRKHKFSGRRKYFNIFLVLGNFFICCKKEYPGKKSRLTIREKSNLKIKASLSTQVPYSAPNIDTAPSSKLSTIVPRT